MNNTNSNHTVTTEAESCEKSEITNLLETLEKIAGQLLNAPNETLASELMNNVEQLSQRLRHEKQFSLFLDLAISNTNHLYREMMSITPNAKKRISFEFHLQARLAEWKMLGFEIIGDNNLIGQPISLAEHKVVTTIPPSSSAIEGMVVRIESLGLKKDDFVFRPADVAVAMSSNKGEGSDESN